MQGEWERARYERFNELFADVLIADRYETPAEDLVASSIARLDEELPRPRNLAPEHGTNARYRRGCRCHPCKQTEAYRASAARERAREPRNHHKQEEAA